MEKYKEYKRAAILSYINLALINVLGIIITPFTIRMLGDSQYGLYTLIGAFVGYLSVLDLGLNNAMIRFIAQYRIQKDKRGEENFLAISFIIYFLISLLIIFVGGLLYLNIDIFFKKTLTIDELSQAKVMTFVLIVNLAITIPGGAFAGICSGYEKFIFPRVLTIIKYIVRTGLLISILYMGSNALGIVILDSALNILFIIATSYYVIHKLKVSIKLHEYKFVYIKEIFSYSIWLFLYSLIYQFQWRTGQIVLGTNASPITVGVFGVGVMLGIYYTTFGNIINGLLIPKAVQSIYNNLSNEDITNQMIKLGRFLIVVLLYIFGAFLSIGKDFIHLWVGDTYIDSWLIGLLIMCAYIFPISQGYAHSILEAKKKLQFKTLSFLFFCFFGVVLGWFLSYQYGVKGMIAGLFTGMILYQIIMNIYYQRVIKLNIDRFIKRAIFPFFIPFLFIIILNYYISLLFTHTNWGIFIVKGIIYSIIYISLIYPILTKEEKKLYIKKK